MQIILASQNKNKLKELSTIFQINLSKHSLMSPRKFLNVIEDKETIKENAEKKALEYFKFYDLPVIADDSGLFVDALNGAPGVHSARFSGEDANVEKNNTKAGVLKFTARIVPAITPSKIKIPKDLTILKSTASYSICVLVDIIEVGIIIAKDVPTDKCILVTISKSRTVKA